MPQIFLEYRPLASEAEFIAFFKAFSKENKEEGTITNAELFKVREGLYLASIAYEPEQHQRALLLYGDSNQDEGNMQSLCKEIRLKYTTKKL